MSEQGTISPQRQFERRQLITIFNELAPGAEIAFEEIKAMVGIDPKLGGDKNLVYGVREHCREVLGVVIEVRQGRYRRATDEEIAGSVTDRRRTRLYRQAVRGAGEAASVADFSALPAYAQHQLLAKQAMFAAAASVSHRESVERLKKDVADRQLSVVNPEEVIAAARLMRQ